MIDFNSLLHCAINASLKAGEEILKIYSNSGTIVINYKKDDSPLTEADMASNRIILDELKKFDFPVLSEESKQVLYEIRKEWDYLWIIDPLDGTKEFIKRNGEFTVNIALIGNSRPVLGVIYAPVLKTLYYGMINVGGYKLSDIDIHGIQSNLDEIIEKSEMLPIMNKNEKYTVIASKSHLTNETEEYINMIRKEYSDIELQSRGSSLKLCMIAEGTADIYPRLAPTMEWDIAAGDAIIQAVGGEVLDFNNGIGLSYNKENLLNPWFIAKRNS